MEQLITPDAGAPDLMRLSAVLPFTKYHGLGNDFILIDARELALDPSLAPLLKDWHASAGRLAPLICDRHFGIGADGIILALPLELEEGDSTDSGSFPARHVHIKDAHSQAASIEQYKQYWRALTNQYPRSDGCSISWVYTNSDGSQSDMCGNGLRCLALWARLRGGLRNDCFKIATKIGPVAVSLSSGGTLGKKQGVEQISVDVGEPILEAAAIPVNLMKAQAAGDQSKASSHARLSFNLLDKNFAAVAVSMGNPHCVIFDELVWMGRRDATVSETRAGKGGANRSDGDAAGITTVKRPEELSGPLKDEMESLARAIQNNDAFPEGVNVEFVDILKRDRVRTYVYERGCGFTLACASGAAAVVVAGVLESKLDRKTSVELPGGVLSIEWNEADNHVNITGPAQEVFSGVVRLDCLDECKSGWQSKAGANCQ